MLDHCATTEDYYDIIMRKTIDRNIPFKVDWEITHRCNLKCQHCYQTRPECVDELSTAEACSVIDQLAEMGALYMTLTGGEIFIRKDILDVAHYARKKDFALRLFTNGTLIDGAMAREIKALNPLTVEISLYAMNPLVHDTITGIDGSYNKTIDAFYHLKRLNITTVVKTTVMKNNVNELDNLAAFAKGIGARFEYALTVVPQTTGKRDVICHRLNEQELENVYVRYPELIKGIHEGGVKSFDPLCSAGINSIYIGPDGGVFPCMLLLQGDGNIREKPLREIWNGPVFKKIRSIRYEDLHACISCEAAAFCDRCAGLAYLEHGDLLGPSLHDCRVAHVRQRAVLRRNNEEQQRSREELQPA